jgi:hypothetical protein
MEHSGMRKKVVGNFLEYGQIGRHSAIIQGSNPFIPNIFKFNKVATKVTMQFIILQSMAFN